MGAPRNATTPHRTIRGHAKRIWWWARHRVADRIGPVLAPRVLRHAKKLPPLPRAFRARYASPKRPWAMQSPSLPPALRGPAATPRDLEAVDRAFEDGPLRDFFRANLDASGWLQRGLWRCLLPVAPRLLRARKAVKATTKVAPAPSPTPPPPGELTASLKARAAELGLSAVGVAAYDPAYTFAEYQGSHVGDRVVVCVLEQHYESTQTIPSPRAEQTALSTYAELMERAAALATLLHEQGYRAHAHDQEGETIVIHYGEQAGLGQLGRNGQLLTPEAGSRCRISVITTDAPLELDQPVDYGVRKICDTCNVCVRRCPVGAIPSTWRPHRGVEKSKLNTKRCFPVVAQADGCAICMKVCPAQRYGLAAVAEHLERTGEILGKGTDDLEGYDWIDGLHYPPGCGPKISEEFLAMEDIDLDATPTLPVHEASTLPAAGADDRPMVM
jgi:epoxyqueuosine reductase